MTENNREYIVIVLGRDRDGKLKTYTFTFNYAEYQSFWDFYHKEIKAKRQPQPQQTTQNEAEQHE